MRRVAVLVVVAGMFTKGMAAQTGSSKPVLRFEVATVKPIDPTPGAMHTVGINVDPVGRLRITTFSLKALICVAFDVNCWQVKGSEPWMEKQMYDVVGQAAETVPATNYNLRHSNVTVSDAKLREMLQSLLIERFHLRYHRETGTGQVYLLQKSGKPVVMEASKQKFAKAYGDGYSGEVGFVGNRWSLYNCSMAQLAHFASDFLHRPVLDRTGLDGAFDFGWTVADADASDRGPQFMDTFRSTFPLFVEAAGLKLVKSIGSVEALLIDDASEPSAN